MNLILQGTWFRCLLSVLFRPHWSVSEQIWTATPKLYGIKITLISLRLPIQPTWDLAAHQTHVVQGKTSPTLVLWFPAAKPSSRQNKSIQITSFKANLQEEQTYPTITKQTCLEYTAQSLASATLDPQKIRCSWLPRLKDGQGSQLLNHGVLLRKTS